jgi:hypothetical protein
MELTKPGGEIAIDVYPLRLTALLHWKYILRPVTRHMKPQYQHLLLTAEKKFWRCVMDGEEPRLFGVEPPRPRLEAVRIVDMSSSNSWAEFAATFRRTPAGLSGA